MREKVEENEAEKIALCILFFPPIVSIELLQKIRPLSGGIMNE